MKQENNQQEKVLTSVRENFKQTTNAIFSALVESADKTVSMLPEAIFVERFLPFFCGEVKITEGGLDYFADWVSVAGTPYAEVSVIDQAGVELFRVPGLFNTSHLNITDRRAGNSIADILEQYNLRKNTLPEIGNRYLADAVEDKTKTIQKQSKDQSVNEQRWISIFQRYGKIAKQTPTKSTENKQDLIDDLDYE